MTTDLGERIVDIATVALFAVGFAAVTSLVVFDVDGSRRNRERPTIVPTASGVTVDVAELPYTFAVPNGFVLSPIARNDACLIPEPWLPTSTRIELRTQALGSNVSGTDAALKYVRSDLLPQRFNEPLESLTAADGSAAVQYRTADVWATVVFHGKTAVFVQASYSGSNEESVLREASRTVVRGLRFR
jgi:hypothetical protein